MAGQTLPWGLEGEGVKTTENKIHLRPLGCKNLNFLKNRERIWNKKLRSPILIQEVVEYTRMDFIKGV